MPTSIWNEKYERALMGCLKALPKGATTDTLVSEAQKVLTPKKHFTASEIEKKSRQLVSLGRSCGLSVKMPPKPKTVKKTKSETRAEMLKDIFSAMSKSEKDAYDADCAAIRARMKKRTTVKKKKNA